MKSAGDPGMGPKNKRLFAPLSVPAVTLVPGENYNIIYIKYMLVSHLLVSYLKEVCTYAIQLIGVYCNYERNINIFTHKISRKIQKNPSLRRASG